MITIHKNTATESKPWPEGRREVAIVGEAIALLAPLPLTCTVLRAPAGSSATFEEQSFTPDTAGLYRLSVEWMGGRRHLELVVFPATALAHLATYPCNASGSSQRVAGAYRPPTERRQILRSVANDGRCSVASIEAALEQGPAPLCGGLNPQLFGSASDDGGLSLGEFGA